MHDIRSSFTSLRSPFLAFLVEAAATNTLVRFASVLALGVGMTRCVPAKSYDEARTAAESEFTAHGRTRERLEAAHERIRTLEQTLAERERAIETGQSSVAEAKLETIVLGKDREAAMELVEQLRSELARTGNHLVAYSGEKRELARALVLAEERVRAIEAAEKNLDELIATARDLALAVAADTKESGVEIGARDGQLVLSLPAAKLFAEGADSLVVDAAPVLTAVTEVSSAHPRVRVVLHAPEADKLGIARVTRLADALRERGVPDARLVLPAGDTANSASPEPTPAPVAIDPSPTESPNAAAVPSVQTPAPVAAPAPATDEKARYEIGFVL